jgi:aldehyde dehydrogenase (NAD+)
MSFAQETAGLLKHLGVVEATYTGGSRVVRSPIDGSPIGAVVEDSAVSAAAKIESSVKAFQAWRAMPAPVRGELVRLFGEELRAHKAELGRLVTLENGKILSEGLGEVQEMIDICDFAVGLSRQLYGLTIASERPGHHMRESWHPLGPVGVISAFNFPVAVWAWNAALALVCGNSVIWKPSEKTPLTALASHAVFDKAAKRFGQGPDGLCSLLLGGADIGDALVSDHRVPLISATGSTRMGARVGPKVAARFGKSILELGGNAAMIVTPSADLNMAIRAICFSAVGTAGQRCTTLRRLIVHESVADGLLEKLAKAYGSLPIGNPLESGTLVGPLIDEAAKAAFLSAIESAKSQGGKLRAGGVAIERSGGAYVVPAIVEMPAQSEIVQTETFAPILYVMRYRDFEDAMALHNGVPQGLSSCIFTLNVREAERFHSALGSDCGIANINMGSSGAEIGGAFGGEKETGGGRESGSDSWKAYMRRQTQMVNWGDSLPLAQGVQFDV